MFTNETLTRWNKAEYGYHSPDGSFGPMPLPSEVNGPVEATTAEEYQQYAEDAKQSFAKGMWRAPMRYAHGKCPSCNETLTLTGQCAGWCS